ncbi:MAG: alpha/beta hydrolase [bacterium]|nr:alpha/beta hydrolase [bacterium]
MGRRTAAVLLCAALLLSACGNDAASESTSDDSALDPGRELSITNNDGQTLEARAWGTGNRYVVLAHMRPADMTSWFDFARLLADEGFTAIAFNFRGYGESGGEPGEFSVAADVRAVVDAAVAEGASAVFVIGASMGGTGAVAASASNDIAGTVTLSAPDEFEGVNAVGLAQFVTTPILLIAADEDGDAADDALAIASEASGETELVVLAGAQHGTNMFAEHGDEITAKILEFLEA